MGNEIAFLTWLVLILPMGTVLALALIGCRRGR